MNKAVSFLMIVLAVSECSHMFMGTNVLRPLVYHQNITYGSKFLSKRVENLHYQLPHVPANYGINIKGILAYDWTKSDASANITQGGLGYDFVNIRMKSGRGHDIKYEIYIYA